MYAIRSYYELGIGRTGAVGAELRWDADRALAVVRAPGRISRTPEVGLQTSVRIVARAGERQQSREVIEHARDRNNFV